MIIEEVVGNSIVELESAEEIEVGRVEEDSSAPRVISHHELRHLGEVLIATLLVLEHTFKEVSDAGLKHVGGLGLIGIFKHPHQRVH